MLILLISCFFCTSSMGLLNVGYHLGNQAIEASICSKGNQVERAVQDAFLWQELFQFRPQPSWCASSRIEAIALWQFRTSIVAIIEQNGTRYFSHDLLPPFLKPPEPAELAFP
jgi:hypothetical protein